MSGSEYKKEAVLSESLKVDQRFFAVPKSTVAKVSSMGKHLFKRFRAKEYDALKREFTSRGLEKSQISDFFLAEGHSLLDWAVNKVPDAKGLAFLCEMVDKAALQEVLLSHDSEILRNFLFFQSGLERTNQYGKGVMASCVAKFKLLLEIDTATVKAVVTSFVKAKDSLGCQTGKMEASFMAALAPQEQLEPSCLSSSYQ